MSFSNHVVPRTDAKTDVVGDRNRLIQVGMAAVWFTLLVFAVQRLVVTLQTGLLTPWWGNAAGLVAQTALWAWYRRGPQTRSSGAAHGTALIATITLLIPVAYGLTSTIWWLSLVGFAAVLLGRRQEALVWGVTISLVVVASVIVEPYVQVQGAAGELPLELALAKIVFVVVLIGMAVGFRRVAEQRALVLHDSEVKAAEALVKNQGLLVLAEKLGKVGGWEFDIETRQQTWTDMVYEIHELEFAGRPTVDQGINFYTPASRPIIEGAIKRAIEQGEPFDVELEIITAKGNRRSVHAIGKTDPARRKVSGFFQDITERKQAEEALQKSEALLQAAVDILPVGLWIINAEGEIVVSSAAAQQLWAGVHYVGIDQLGEYKGWRTDSGKRIEAHEWAGARALEKGETSLEEEVEIECFDGTHKIILDTAVPLRESDGSISGAITINQDITQRKQAEAALRAIEARFKSLVETQSDLIARSDLDGCLTFVNDAYCKTFGKAREELLGKVFSPTVSPEDMPTVTAMIEAIQSPPHQMLTETRHPTPSGLRWFSWDNVAVLDESGKVQELQGIGRDITERKQAEQALLQSRRAALNMMTDAVEARDRAEQLSKELQGHRDHLERLVAERTEDLQKSEERFRTVAEFTYDWEYWIDADRRMLYVSPSCERITGFPPTRFYEDPHFIDTIIHPDDRWSFLKHIELQHLGSSTDKSGEMEFRIVDRNGCTKWVDHICTPVSGDNGVFLGRRASNRDITDRKHAEEELKRQSTQLESANKELEAFSYSVSHDLRAPLRGIDGWSLALLEDYGSQLDGQAKTYLERVRSETQRMGQLIDDLLQLSRLTSAEMSIGKVDLSALARTIAGSLQKAQPDRRVELVIQPRLNAHGDARLLEIALTNLLGNAFKFTGKTPQARIEFGQTEVEGQRAFFVRDNGAGFDMALAKKLFGPFQRMHKASDFPGTGVGLTTVQRIVHRHGGRIWAEAAVDQGATFYFTLEEIP